MAQVYIIHGYTASADHHWFPWLEQELAKLNIPCQRLTMPDSNNPAPDRWLDYLAQQVSIDENTILVGHSLGCITWLNFLAKHYHKPAGAIFVSGFYQPLENLPELTPFSNLYAIQPPLLDFKSVVISALDDHIVPYQYSDELAKHLKADYFRLATGGHFLDREGFTELPIVLEQIKKMLSA